MLEEGARHCISAVAFIGCGGADLMALMLRPSANGRHSSGADAGLTQCPDLSWWKIMWPRFAGYRHRAATKSISSARSGRHNSKRKERWCVGATRSATSSAPSPTRRTDWSRKRLPRVWHFAARRPKDGNLLTLSPAPLTSAHRTALSG
jgi:hypothetical protein